MKALFVQAMGPSSYAVMGVGPKGFTTLERGLGLATALDAGFKKAHALSIPFEGRKNVGTYLDGSPTPDKVSLLAKYGNV